jgi:hypothetical protein
MRFTGPEFAAADVGLIELIVGGELEPAAVTTKLKVAGPVAFCAFHTWN